MTFWHGFWIITGVHLLACMSPGPDFVLVSQQALSRGRAAGMLTALGIALGFGIHIIYSVLGLVTLVAQSAPAVSKRFQRFGHWIDRFCGGALALLGIKVISG